MPFPFIFAREGGEVAVDVSVMVARDAETWTWLHSSRSWPVRLEPSEWPEGLATSVDVRNQARDGQRKGRVLIIRHGPALQMHLLRPVAVLGWHAHLGNWPLTVLDCGYCADVDPNTGEFLVNNYLLAALADLNDRPEFCDRAVSRPKDRLGWAVRRRAGAGTDSTWARTVAWRAQAQWGFTVVRPKSARPSWARDGFYGERPR